MVDAGDALTEEGRVVNAKKVVTDGPFVESKEIVGGYSIVKADTIDAAAELAKGCPALLTGGKVEVRTLAGTGIQGLRSRAHDALRPNGGRPMSSAPTGTGRSARGAFFSPRGGATGGRADPLLRLAELRPRRGHGAGHAARRLAVVARSRSSRKSVGLGSSRRQEQDPRRAAARPRSAQRVTRGVGRPAPHARRRTSTSCSSTRRSRTASCG